jgi:hypothetical protein
MVFFAGGLTGPYPALRFCVPADWGGGVVTSFM